MPSGRKPKRWPDHAVVKTDISLPGRVRNELADHCESIGSNMNEWCGVVIREAFGRRGIGTQQSAACGTEANKD